MLHYLTVYARSLLRNKEGASAVEYGLLVALIAAVIIIAVTTLGTTLNGTFTYVNDQLPSH